MRTIAHAARSISGVPLNGNRLVRVAYLDEAGVSNPNHEPFLVVGGIIIDADRQMIAIEDRIDEICSDHIPEEDREGFVFHATELWSGGSYFDRKTWPREKRHQISMDIISIPRDFDIPISFGFI